MIPQESLSSSPVIAPFQGAAQNPITDVVDYEDGGVAIQDPSQGLLVREWRARIVDDGTAIEIDSDGVDPVTWVTGVSITEVSLAFDQNMNPAVAFVDGNIAKLNWFDSSVGEQVTTEFENLFNPRVTLDDKRASQNNASDIIFAYLRNGSLYYRQHRDRFEIERLLMSSVEGKLVKMAMNRKLRLQFEFELPTVEPMVMLDVSGNTRTWDMTQAWRSMGKKGEYDKRVIFRRLGQHRSFTPRIAISAPVKRAIFAAYADIRPQRS